MIPTRGTDSTLEPAYFASLQKEEKKEEERETGLAVNFAAAVANGVVGMVGNATKIEEEEEI